MSDEVSSTRPAPSVHSPAAASGGLLPLEPMDPQLTCDQPGGGVVIRLELAWGRWRRWWLRTFRPSYVARMRASRKGTQNRCPHDVLDPRDLKFYRNQGGYEWDPADDPFLWRDRLPFARAGLAELMIFSLIAFGSAAVLAGIASGRAVPAAWSWLWWLASAAMAVIGGLIVWFFRNPVRRIPQAPGTVVSPADGVVSTIEDIEFDEFVDGPAVLIGIFLSIFNVHINRASLAGRVVGLRYRKGKFLNAMRPESSRENEQLTIRMQASGAPYRRFIVRQITGAIARRIVCWLKPGDELAAGEQFGMIKFGSRTELVIPREDALELRVAVGQVVRAGSSVLAVYREPE